MKRFWLERGFVITRWSHEEVRIVGLYHGWETLLLPIVFLLVFSVQGLWLVALILEYAPWLMALVAAMPIVALGYQFDARIVSDGMELREQLWGWVINRKFLDAEEVMLEFAPGAKSGFDCEENTQDRAMVRNADYSTYFELGDNFSALALHQAFEQGWRMVHEHASVVSSHPTAIFEHVPAPSESTPTDIRKVAAKVVSHARSKPLIFVEGWSFEATRRIGVWLRYNGRLQLVFDGYVDAGQIEGLRERIAQEARVIDGDWDEMAHTSRRRWVWSTDPFILYRRTRAYLRVESHSMFVGQRIILNHEIQRVLSVFTGWTTGVQLELKDGTRVKVARHVCWGAIFDPLYDTWALEFDTIWSESLSRCLAEAIQVDWEREGY